jgi:hypothetical protein
MKLARPLGIVAALAAAGLAVLAALFAFLLSLDLDRFKPALAAQVKAATGRDLVIEGRLAPRFGLTPSLAIEGVSLSNAPWGENRPMLTVERFEARLRLLPLVASLGRHIVVERVVLTGADLWLETDETGSANWRFPAAGAGAGRGGVSEPAGAEPQMPEIEVLDLEFRRVKVGLKLGAAAPRTLALDNLTLRGEGGAYWFDGVGRVDRMPFDVGGRLARRDAGGLAFDFAARSRDRASLKVGGELRRPFTGSDYDIAFAIAMPEIGRLAEIATEAGFAGFRAPSLGPLSIAVEVSDKGPDRRIGLDGIRIRLGEPAGPRAAVDGVLRDPLGPVQRPPVPPGLDLRIAVVAPDIGDVAQRLGLAPSRRGTLDFSATLRDEGAPRIAMPSLKLTGPGMDLTGVGAVSFEGERPVWNLRLRGEEVDLAWLAPAPAPATTGRAAAPIPRPAGRLIPDIAIPYDLLAAADLDVDIGLGTLGLPRVSIRSLSVGMRGRRGQVQVEPLRFVVEGGTFSGAIGLSAGDRTIAPRLVVDGLELGSVLASPDWLRGGLARLRADLRAEGERLPEAFGTLAGSVDLDVGPAQLGQGLRQDVAAWLADIAPPLAQIQFGLTMRCAAYALRFDGGVGTLMRGVIDAGPVALRTAGTIDLGQETLALRSQLGPLGFRTTGTLAAPQHRLDATGSARGVAEGAAGAIRDLLGGLRREPAGDAGACRNGDGGAAPAAPDAETGPLGLPGPLRDLLRR